MGRLKAGRSAATRATAPPWKTTRTAIRCCRKPLTGATILTPGRGPVRVMPEGSDPPALFMVVDWLCADDVVSTDPNARASSTPVSTSTMTGAPWDVGFSSGSGLTRFGQGGRCGERCGRTSPGFRATWPAARPTIAQEGHRFRSRHRALLARLPSAESVATVVRPTH
jgi:hypothetical protein